MRNKLLEKIAKIEPQSIKNKSFSQKIEEYKKQFDVDTPEEFIKFVVRMG